MRRPVILNAAGKPIRLTTREEKIANYATRKANALGYDIDITSLTTIIKKITEQKFFEIAPADYLPVRVGEGAWSQVLTTYRSFDASSQFEEGIVNTGGQNSRMATADAAVDALNIQVYNWAKQIGWSLMDLQMAAKAGNWDLISAKEEARKRNWDLGIQRIAFLGANGNNGSQGKCLGLLNQTGVEINVDLITKPLSTMTPTELKAFQAAIIEAYRENCARTAWPTHFIIPESDYNGLASQASPEFPIKSTLELLEEAFKLITRNSAFKILPLAYGDAQYHAGIAGITGKQLYTLLRYDEKSVRMDIPVNYTNTLANTVEGFNWQNVGYGQFTGVLAYRPLEMMYFRYPAA